MRGAPCLVLIVEDEAPLREPLEQLLQSRGFDVVSASTSKDALGLLRCYQPDAAIVDLCLREGHGRDVIVKVPASVPVVIFSATRAESGRLEHLRPRTRLIEKPCPLAHVADTLEEMLA